MTGLRGRGADMHQVNKGRWIAGVSLQGIGAVWLMCAMAAATAAPLRELYTTRTSQPQPSPGLMTALNLTVPEWEGDASAEKIKIAEADLRRADEAGLSAIDALPASAISNDFDRAWVAYARARTLAALGRKDEAIAQLQRLRSMPRTALMDRYALIRLHELGDASAPGWCKGVQLSEQPTFWRIDYPSTALKNGIEGWVDVMYDVGADGTVGVVTVAQSSMQAFEPPLVKWLQRLKLAAPGQPCFGYLQREFTLHQSATSGRVTVPHDAIERDPEYSLRYIGVSLAIRREARNAIIAARKRQPVSESAGPERVSP